ncbi:MAG TPA: hypothetical protein VHD83_15250 [Puia sp.]|nr:hypothetical protein [Puia sp.]
MKKYAGLLPILLINIVAHACPACERAQPRLFRGITHGGGPDSRWDYLIVWLAIIATVVTLFYSIKWLIHPGESDTAHIKHSIFHHDTIG